MAAEALFNDADLLRVGTIPPPTGLVRREDLKVRNDLRACHRAWSTTGVSISARRLPPEGYLRPGGGRVLPVGHRPAGDIAAAGGGASLSPARLRAVGRGGGRAVGREPVLPARLRGDLLPAPSADRPLLAHPLAQAHRRRGCRMAADEVHRGRPRLGSGRRQEPPSSTFADQISCLRRVPGTRIQGVGSRSGWISPQSV